MKNKLLAAAAVGAMVLGFAGSANATVRVFNLDTYEAGFVGNLGTITVNDFGAVGSVQVDVALATGVAFQIPGSGALWWDLGGGDTSISGLGTVFTTPAGGTYPTGGSFADAVFSNNAFRSGSGFLSGFDYRIAVTDSVNPKDYYGAPLHLIFTLSGLGLNAASFTSQSETPSGGTATNVFFGADLRQTLATGAVITGPAGATECFTRECGGGGGQGGVPEPATWAMMILGRPRLRPGPFSLERRAALSAPGQAGPSLNEMGSPSGQAWPQVSLRSTSRMKWPSLKISTARQPG